MKLLIVFFLLMLSLPAISKDWSLTHFQAAVGAEYLSNLNKRGATLYEGYQVIPIFAIELFHPDFELIGSTLNYKHRINPYLLLRTRLNLSASGDKPLYETNAALLEQREGTMEWDGFIEFALPGRGELSLEYSQDLKTHKGFYTEAKIRIVVTDFSFRGRTFEPAVFASLGGGNLAHNSYLYGVGSSDYTATNYSLGVSLSAPPEIDHFFPVLQFKYYELIGDATRTASFIGSRNSGFQVLGLFAFKL
ncbi:hypothetical protein COB52_04725 [Candidatus Kaiserbacteria bacterium]|nr:MAG: hypothetical protein COB52_04725 [Candidatus Kaiserbacteria bacterium]